MPNNMPVPKTVRREMTHAFAADPILKYGALNNNGSWFVARDRKERSISLAENRKMFPRDGWRCVAMRDWVDWDYYRTLGSEKIAGEKKP